MRPFRPTLLHDGAMAAISFPLALYLRWGPSFLAYTREYILAATLMFTVISVAAVLRQRAHQGLWRYTSLPDVLALIKAAILAVFVFYAILFVTTRLDSLPRTVPILHLFMLLTLWLGPRALYRLSTGGALRDMIARTSSDSVPVLLLGANDQAELFLRETQRNPGRYHVVGIVDDDPKREGRKLHGVTIYGSRQALPKIVKKLEGKKRAPRRLILTAQEESDAIKSLFAVTEKIGLGIARLPSLSALHAGTEQAISLQPVAIEDLLGRAQSQHDFENLKALVTGQVVLVTGAGGTIGSELCRQIASLEPKRLILLDHAEFSLYQIGRELAAQFAEVLQTSVLGDVREGAAMMQIMQRHQPALIFHAAAIKHVPIAEDNVEETVLTNVLGAANVAEAAAQVNARALVFISTDKAVNPSSVMGATKRLAESVIQAMGQQCTTKFITVRFGNVLGSTGSVVPLFQQQLSAGGPITVTHKDMVRYFMTVREAACLVLEAAHMGLSEVLPPIYVLDMGEPVRIEELALQMIRLAGLTLHTDIAIEYTGLRPGEKLSEELFHESEALGKTAHAGILRAKARAMTLDMLAPMLESLNEAARARDAESVRALLHELVPEFKEMEY